jgi:predicted dehydrogenase
LREARLQYPQLQQCANIEDVLDRIDAVVVSVPPERHALVAQSSLAAGKHTLVEKPFTSTSAQAQDLIATAKEHRAKLMVGHTYLYHHALEVMKSVIASGELGDIIYIDSARLALGRYRNDTDVIWDLAPHDISIISYLLEDRPGAVEAWEHYSRHFSRSDLAYIRLEFPNGVTAFINVSWIAPHRTRRVTVVGSKKMATYDYLSIEPLRIYDMSVKITSSEKHDGREVPSADVIYNTGDIITPYVAPNEPLVAQDSHFVECIRSNIRPRTPGEDGLENVQVLTAITESSRSRKQIRLH